MSGGLLVVGPGAPGRRCTREQAGVYLRRRRGETGNATAPATLSLAAEIPASATKWRALKKGQRYEDPTASEDGIERLTLRTSKRQRSRVLVNGGGSNLQVPSLPLQLPVKVQVTNSETGVCWEAEYWPDDVVKNAVNKFRAKK
jgi:hypothetical protein